MISWKSFEDVVVNGVNRHVNTRVMYDGLMQVPRGAGFEVIEATARASLNAVYDSLGLPQEVRAKLMTRPVVLPTVVNRETQELYYLFVRDITLLPCTGQVDKLQRVLQVASVLGDAFGSETLMSTLGSREIERICPRVYICSVDVVRGIFSLYFQHTYSSTLQEFNRLVAATGNTHDRQLEFLSYVCPGHDPRYIIQSKVAITGVDYVRGVLAGKLKYYFCPDRLTEDELRRLEEVSGFKVADSAARLGLHPDLVHLIGIGIDFSADEVVKVKHYFRAG